MGITHLPGFTLQPPHPFAGREAYQCDVCSAITFPPDPDKGCPVCAEEDDEE